MSGGNALVPEAVECSMDCALRLICVGWPSKGCELKLYYGYVELKRLINTAVEEIIGRGRGSSQRTKDVSSDL
jgi:hypothetical protein